MKFPELPTVLVSLLLTVLLAPEPAVGLPATQTGYISVPLTSVHDPRDPNVHPDIVSRIILLPSGQTNTMYSSSTSDTSTED